MPPLSLLIRKDRIKMASDSPIDHYFSLVHGRRLEIIGAPGTGKTQLCVAYAASALASGGKVAWISDRAFPADLWKTPTQQIQCFRLDLQELVRMAPLAVDLVVIEHYEYMLGPKKDEWRAECELISLALARWSGAVVATTTPSKSNNELIQFAGGLNFTHCWLWHLSPFSGAIEGTIGVHHFRMHEDVPSTNHLEQFLSDPPESPWGEDSSAKKRRIFLPGSPKEVRATLEYMSQT